MGLFGKLFKGKPQDSEVKAAYKTAYDTTYREERLKVATERGRVAAQRKAHAKPFFQQLSGGLGAVVKDFSTTKGRRDDPFGLFGNDTQPLKPPKKRRAKKRRRKR